MSTHQTFTIDQVGWHTNTPGNPESVSEIHTRFKIIIAFLQDNGLTTRTILPADQPISDSVKIASADLTSDGLTIMQKCYDKWLCRLDQGFPSEDTTLLHEQLLKLRAG